MRLEPPSEGVHGPQELPQDSSHRFELWRCAYAWRVQGCAFRAAWSISAACAFVLLTACSQGVSLDGPTEDPIAADRIPAAS
jgi:hypothetical protein